MPPARSFEVETRVTTLALSPSGPEIVAGLKNAKLQVFSTAGKPLRSWSGGESAASAIACSGNGRRIIAASGKSLHVFEAETGRRLHSWTAHREEIGVVACSRDGSLIASADGHDPAVKLWTGDGSPLQILDGGLEILGLSVTLSGERVAAGSSDTKVRVFSARTGVLERSFEFPMACAALVFSPDGRFLAAGCVDGSVALFDALSGEAKGVLGRHAIPAGAAAFSPDGGQLACAGASINPWGAEAELKIWDLATRKESSTPIGVSFMNALGFTPAGRLVAASVRDRTISVWEGSPADFRRP